MRCFHFFIQSQILTRNSVFLVQKTNPRVLLEQYHPRSCSALISRRNHPQRAQYTVEVEFESLLVHKQSLASRDFAIFSVFQLYFKGHKSVIIECFLRVLKARFKGPMGHTFHMWYKECFLPSLPGSTLLYCCLDIQLSLSILPSKCPQWNRGCVSSLLIGPKFRCKQCESQSYLGSAYVWKSYFHP